MSYKFIHFLTILLLIQNSYQILNSFLPGVQLPNVSLPVNTTGLSNSVSPGQVINGSIVRTVSNLTEEVIPLNTTFTAITENIVKNYTLTTKCFQNLGCITSDTFFDTLKTLPLVFTDPQELNVTFNLFTRQNRNRPQVFNYKPNNTELNRSLFSANRKTKFIIHGYMSGYKEDNWMAEIKDYLLNDSNYNVLAIDWSKGADSINYFQSAVNTRVVGAMIAHFIKKLVNVTNARHEDIHCIGHSLGAHTCGFVGQRIQNPKLRQISGLDPAGPGFLLNDTNTRLDKTDANLVIVLHTNAGVFTSEGTLPVEVTGILGNNNHLGHLDFWPNGGSKQPGCAVVDILLNITNNPSDILKAPTCNHERAHVYPKTPKQNNCQFIAYHCVSYAEFEEGKCAECGTDDQNCKPMELGLNFFNQLNKTNILQNVSKDYYLETNNSQPFCLFHYQVLVQISRNSSSIARGRLDIKLNNEKEISMSRSLTGSETGQDSGFKAGDNYTNLYLDSNQLTPTTNITIKWSSLLRNTIKIDKISIKFMSHFDKRYRLSKSKNFCNTIGNSLSNGESLVMERCHQIENNII